MASEVQPAAGATLFVGMMQAVVLGRDAGARGRPLADRLAPVLTLWLRAVSVQNFTSPASNLSVRFHRDEFSTIPKLLLSKVSEMQLFDLDDHSATRDVFFPFLSGLTSYDLMSVPLLL